MFIFVLFLYFGTVVFGNEIVLSDKYTFENSIYLGEEHLFKVDALFSFDHDIIFLTNVESESVQTLDGRLVYDDFHIKGYKSSISCYEYDKNASSTVSFGWFASQMECGVTYIKKTLFSCIPYYRLIGDGLKMYFSETKHWCVDNMHIEFPNGTIAKSVTICLLNDATFINLPRDFFPLDRTKQNCYKFLNLTSNNVCSLDLNENEKTSLVLQNIDDKVIYIGTKMENFEFAITQIYSERYLWKTWDEKTTYSQLDFMLIIISTIYLIFWSLYFCDQNNFLGLIFLKIGTIFFLQNIIYQYFFKNLYNRIIYVVNDSTTQFYEIYIIFGIFFMLMLFLFLMKYGEKTPNNWNLQKLAFETMIGLSIASMFLGRLQLTEEFIISFLIGNCWIFLQIITILKMNQSKILFLFFYVLIFFPFFFGILVEPSIRFFPGLEIYSFTSSFIIILIPLVIVNGYKILQVRMQY